MSEAVTCYTRCSGNTFEEGAARASLLLFPIFSLALALALWRFTDVEKIGKLKLADTDVFLFMFILLFESLLVSYFTAFSFASTACVFGECQKFGEPTEAIMAWIFTAGWPLVFATYVGLRATKTINFGFVIFESENSLVANLTPKRETKVAPQPVPTTTENPLGWRFTIGDRR